MQLKATSKQTNKSSIDFRRLYSSAINLAALIIILFFVISAILSLIGRIQETKNDSYKSFSTAVKVFTNVSVKPNIILFGSSPLRMSSFLADRENSYFVEDYNRYCHPQVLQSILETAGLKDVSIFNFAIDGEMVSDALAINQKLLQGTQTPKWIIYGITPRDFIDNTLNNERETPINRRLATSGESINNFLNLLPNTIKNLFLKTTATASNISELEISAPRVNPEAWQTSIDEYRPQYHVFDQAQFQKQRACLIAFCKECQHKGIKLLLVNMPLPEEHLRLLPPKAYAEYHKAIVETEKLSGVSLLDLQDSKSFPNAFFADIARLNENGAHVLNLLISNKLISLQGNRPNIIDGLASWWLTKAYLMEPNPPDIVVLGSSHLAPLLGADTYIYDKPVDITGDHRSRVLEYDIHVLLKKNWRVFIGALPGAMISDQLVISRALFSKEYKPKLVAITFSPIDFIDNCFPLENYTEAFAFFSKYTDSNTLRNDLDKARTNKYRFKQTYNYGFENRSSLALGEPFERLCPGELVIRSSDGYSFKDDTKEYRQRYKNPLSPQLDKQMNCLDSLLKYLAQQHIQVVAFNFPISTDNRKLLPNKFWQYYNDRISEICRKNGADLISADRVVAPFEKNELIDGTHLNLVGGLKWSRTVAVYTANKFALKTFQELLACVKSLK